MDVVPYYQFCYEHDEELYIYKMQQFLATAYHTYQKCEVFPKTITDGFTQGPKNRWCKVINNHSLDIFNAF